MEHPEQKFDKISSHILKLEKLSCKNGDTHYRGWERLIFRAIQKLKTEHVDPIALLEGTLDENAVPRNHQRVFRAVKEYVFDCILMGIAVDSSTSLIGSGNDPVLAIRRLRSRFVPDTVGTQDMLRDRWRECMMDANKALRNGALKQHLDELTLRAERCVSAGRDLNSKDRIDQVLRSVSHVEAYKLKSSSLRDHINPIH